MEFPVKPRPQPDNHGVKALADTLGMETGTVNSLLWTLIALLAVLVLRRLARRIVGRNVDLEEGAYRANKLINYSATGLFLATVAFNGSRPSTTSPHTSDWSRQVSPSHWPTF